MLTVDLYRVPAFSPDGALIHAYALEPAPGARKAGRIRAPEGSAVERRRGSASVLLVPTGGGVLALSPVDAAQQAEVGGCGLSLEGAGRAAM